MYVNFIYNTYSVKEKIVKYAFFNFVILFIFWMLSREKQTSLFKSNVIILFFSF